MNLDSLVTVAISRATVAISQQDISTINILSNECNFSDRIRFYTDAAGAASDLIGGSKSYTYRMIQKAFSQPKRAARIAVSNVGSMRAIIIDAGTMTAGSFSVNINGTVYTTNFATDKATTVTALGVALAAVSGITVTTLTTGSGATLQTAFVLSRAAGGMLNVSASVTATGTVTCGLTQCGMLLENGGTYTAGPMNLTVNTTSAVVQWTSNKATTMAAIATAIAANSNTLVPIASYVSGSQWIIWVAALGAKVQVSADDSLITGTMSLIEGAVFVESVTDTLDAVSLVSNDWYFVLSTLGGSDTATVLASQKLIADWVESRPKFYSAITLDINAYNVAKASDTTSLLYYLQSRSYLKSICFVTKDPAGNMNDAAFLGFIAPLKPGSYNPVSRTLSGVTPDQFTPTQELIIKDKYGCFYTSCNANGTVVGLTVGGKVGGNEWIDTIIGIDWMTGLIKTTVFGVEVNTQKIPYDDRGLALIGSAVSSALSQGLPSADYSGLFTEKLVDKDGVVIGGYIVSIVKASTISANDKNSRILPSGAVTFIAYLSGAINSVAISGVVTV